MADRCEVCGARNETHDEDHNCRMHRHPDGTCAVCGDLAFTLEKAVEIVRACARHAFFNMGLLDDPPPSLYPYTLKDLLEAQRIVTEAEDAGTLGRNEDGSRNTIIKCDDRLLAALYVAYHYPADDPKDCEAKAISCDGHAVLVLPVSALQPGEDEE